MAVSVIDMIMGPATIYTGAFGATEPADAVAAPGAAFTDAGGTMGGVSVEITQEYKELEVDQLVDVPESRLTKRLFVVKTQLTEATLANLKLTLNGGTITTGTTDSFDPSMTDSGTRPTYAAMILDGPGQGGFKRRFIARKVLSTEGVKFAYEKDGQKVFEVGFKGHYVSQSVMPFRVLNAKS